MRFLLYKDDIQANETLNENREESHLGACCSIMTKMFMVTGSVLQTATGSEDTLARTYQNIDHQLDILK